MYRFIQRNNKKLLAVFAAFLMIVFILPSSLDQFGGGGRDPVWATVDGEELHMSEFQNAEREWRMLSELRAGGPPTQFGAQLPFAYRLGWNPAVSEMELFQGFPPVPVRAISENPRLYLLLQHEARRMGIGISADRVNDVVFNELGGLTGMDKRQQEEIRRAVANFLLVQAAYERASSVVKVSEPVVKHAVAQRTQHITVNVVEVPTTQYARQLPAPTTQQLQGQFEKFANTDPQVDPKTNPFGFGYRYPNRVKLQYIMVPRDEVRKMVEASRTPYEWEVAAQEYYLQNQSQFPSTQRSPATSTTGPATATATATAATAPTTRPFEEVRDDAKGRILVPEVERRAAEIQNRIAAIMASDFAAFRNAGGGTTQPTTGATSTTAPNSSQGVPYNSYDYLQRLAQSIQRDFKVLPTVAAFDDQLRGAAELEKLERIGSASVEENQLPFAQYATNAAQPFLPEERRDDSTALAVLAPSRPLRDAGSNTYLFRLTAADPAHAPKSIDEVAERVAADVRAAAAYDAAKADAGRLLDQAKQSGLRQAAQSSQKSVLTIGPFPYDVRGVLPGVSFTEETSVTRFAEGAFKLLSTPAPPREGAKPATLIELPREGKLFVAELVDVAPRPQMAMRGGDNPAAEIERGLLMGMERDFEVQWFDFADATKRLNYEASELASREDRPSQTPRTPLPRPLPM